MTKRLSGKPDIFEVRIICRVVYIYISTQSNLNHYNDEAQFLAC